MEQGVDAISVRQMKLKVLYTFDANHQTNCLARSPQVLEIQTAYIDETTQIGVIELKTCIQSVVSASPELITKLDQDYTVYAYDYSESDTPLVGQGMLSWILASSSSTSSTPIPQPNAMVTGRVSRSVLGLFSKGGQETLEVKLRLVPVTKTSQNEYLNSLQRYREISNNIGRDFDPEAWSAFVQANPGLASAGSPLQAPHRSASPMDRSGLERVQQMLSEGSTPKETGNSSSDPFSVQHMASTGRPGSRSTTPSLPRGDVQPPKRSASRASRPSSRASLRGSNVQQLAANPQRRQSISAGYNSSDEAFEEGPTKKRAKVTKASWPGKSNMNIERQPDSLRVAASTAASVRIHRPVPLNPAVAQQVSNEEPVRPPTPIPNRSAEIVRRGLPAPSNLRRQSQSQSRPDPVPSYSPPNSNNTESNLTSPEDSRDGSAAATPVDITSSPPIAFTENRLPVLSSPTLPARHQAAPEHDSGFMSGDFEDPFARDNSFGLDLLDTSFLKDQQESAHFSPMDPSLNAGSNRPGNTSVSQNHQPIISTLTTNLPSVFDQLGDEQAETDAPAMTDMLLSGPSGHGLDSPIPRNSGSRPSSRASNRPDPPLIAPAPYPRSRQFDPEQSSGLVLPPIPASDPVQPHSRSLQRSQTWAGDMSSVPASDAPGATEIKKPAKIRSGSSSKLVGKHQTKARLETAISEGSVPPYCENCGTIETPAWRRAWAKTFSEGFEDIHLSNEEGGFLLKEILERDEKGEVILFRAFKKSLAALDKDFDIVQLCNPCGLWLIKNGIMRPEHVWNKGPKDPKEKKKRPSRPRSQRRSATKSRNRESTESDAAGAAADASSPGEGGSEGGQLSDNDEDDSNGNGQKDSDENEDDGEPQLPPMPARQQAKSPPTSKAPSQVRSHGANSKASATSKRGTQSSPIHNAGIDGFQADGDFTPKHTRRLLFPSPRKEGEMKVLGDMPVNQVGAGVRRSPRLNGRIMMPGISDKVVEDKENRTPGDGLGDLFDDDGDHALPPPTTPTPTRRSTRLLLKTPSKQTPRGNKEATPAALSPAAQRLLQTLRTPKGSESRQRASNALLNSGAEATPFTLQLNQLLSDAMARTSPAGPNSDLNFDFPDLPSLKGTPTHGHSIVPTFDFSEFSSLDPSDLDHLEGLLSTDMPMPSSPPNEFFNMYESAAEQHVGIWSDYSGSAPMAPPARRVSPRRRGAEGRVDFSRYIDEVAGGE